MPVSRVTICSSLHRSHSRHQCRSLDTVVAATQRDPVRISGPRIARVLVVSSFVRVSFCLFNLPRPAASRHFCSFALIRRRGHVFVPLVRLFPGFLFCVRRCPFSSRSSWADPARHNPSIAFRHLPPNSARFSYATEGPLFISAQLSTDAVSALRKFPVLM